MKQRFSSLDVKIIAHELNARLTTLRVSNIYDLSTRIFLFKFQKPDHKEQFLIDSGFRCHLTSFVRATAAAPSPFVQKLRKCLKTRRVTGVAQVGTDRIIEFTFSDGLYKLYLEFYAGGNVVLTDAEATVITLLRNVNEGAEHERLRVGLKYDFSMRQNINGVPPLSKQRIKAGLEKAAARPQEDDGTKKAKKKGKDALRKSLAVSINEFPPILVDHAMKIKQFDSTLKPEEVLSSEDLLEQLLGVLQEAQQVVSQITASEVATGYILAKKDQKKASAEDGEEKSGLLYEDFHPFKPAQFDGDEQTTFVEVEGFNKTVDEFFSSIEGQKLESRLQEREEAAKRRLQQARQDHDKRIGGLQAQQELNILKAEAILANVERVEEAQAAVNGLIAQGMDWVDIAKLIEAEQSRGNPVANMVKLPLKLYENTVTLLLGEAEEDQEEDFEGSDTGSEASDSDDESVTSAVKAKKRGAEDKRLAIDIDLSLTPWANASQYYDQKKSAAVKEEKTVQASAVALKSTERKIAADLKKGLKQEKDILRPVRKQFWFEKFHYFISSDGYLVLGGKDAQQNELLYRRYLRKGDIYVHADLTGASSVIIKNNPSTPDAPIPPSTLSQAGNLSVAASSAWDSKAMMSAWWVNADQVSKTAPTGEYLSTGGFMVRGKKNFLPPAQLLLGFAIMWQISDESKANHRKHRVDDDRVVTARNGIDSLSIADESTAVDKADDDEEDDEEGFPDAKLETKQVESDDEDFPDAKLERPESDVESDDDDGNAAFNSNPLQSRGDANATSGDQDDEASNDEPTAAPVSTTNQPSRKHLTAQQRKALKSGKIPDEAEEDADSDAMSVSTRTTQKQKSQPLPRGKRGKQKKAAAKYADQDEEDRELAMQLLGSRAGQDTVTEAAAAKKAKIDEEAAQKQRRREQHLKNQAEGKKSEEQRQAKLEGEGDDEEEDDETTRLSLLGLDGFTGRPLPGDELLAAIPICAPFTALAAYKYKAKLQPGSQKKGKAVNEILGKWNADAKNPKALDRTSQDTERIWPREAELIAGLKATEVVGVIPVKTMRVMMAGGSDGKGGGGGGGKGKKGPPRGGKGKKK